MDLPCCARVASHDGKVSVIARSDDHQSNAGRCRPIEAVSGDDNSLRLAEALVVVVIVDRDALSEFVRLSLLLPVKKLVLPEPGGVRRDCMKAGDVFMRATLARQLLLDSVYPPRSVSQRALLERSEAVGCMGKRYESGSVEPHLIRNGQAHVVLGCG